MNINRREMKGFKRMGVFNISNRPSVISFNAVKVGTTAIPKPCSARRNNVAKE